MKHLYSLSLLLLALLLPATALAHDFEVDGIYYNINGNEATVSFSLNGYSGDLTIPATVTYDGITYSVTSIGSHAFYDCSGLTSITIPNSVTSIGKYAFCQCPGLARIQVASDNPIYDSRNDCNAIIETATNTLIIGCVGTVIPNSVTSIGDEAFRECTGLTSIFIPNSITSIGVGAFAICFDLKTIIVANDNPIYDSRDNSNAIIETATNSLIAGCMNTLIPNSITSIGHGAFYYCFDLTSIIIPNSVTSIGDGAFEYCISLANVNIGNSVTTIGKEAFWSCNLTSVTIPNSVNSIGDGAFYYCSLQDIYCLALTPPTIDTNTFYFASNATLYVPEIALEAFKAADYWKDFNIIGMPYTFEVNGTSYHATTLSTASVMANSEEGTLYSGDVVIPDSVTFEGYTFAVTGIEGNAFDGCFELTSITIPNSVETIGEQAFQGCTGLTSVTIGSGVTGIGAKAFNYCNALETVKCIGTVPPVMASTDCFSTAAYNRATLLVPRQQIEAYQAADYWYKFAHIDGWGSAGRGDIDGDGVVSINDVTRMIDAILTGEHEGVYFESADLNLNGRLDIGDVTTIIDMLLNDIE